MDCRLPAGINRPMRINPVSGLVMAVALGIIFVGAGEYLCPASGALGFGVLLLIRKMPIYLQLEPFGMLYRGYRRSPFSARIIASSLPVPGRLNSYRAARWPGRSSSRWLGFTPVLLVHWGNSGLHAGNRRAA